MTPFFELVKRESVGVGRKIVITTAVSAIANVAILAVINAAAQNTDRGTLNIRYFLLFILALTLYNLCLRVSSQEMNRVMIGVVNRIRVRIAHKVQASELLVLERIGKSEVLKAVTNEATIIADSGELMISLMHASIILLFGMLYVAWLSLPAFFLTLIASIVGVAVVQMNRSMWLNWMRATKDKEIEFLSYITEAIDGFKETKLNRRRLEELGRDIERCSNEISELSLKTEALLNQNSILAQSTFYVLIGTVIFLLPQFMMTDPTVIMEITTATLFIISPLRVIVGNVQYLTRANEATRAVLNLERALDEGHEEARHGKPLDLPLLPPSFETITLDQVTFSYNHGNQEKFPFGPVAFTVNAGEIVFIIGGNGSGKSTMLKVIAGLYPPDTGTILVDGMSVKNHDVQSYRELFTAVFADFHLFSKLYGLGGTDDRLILQLIKTMQLEKKVGYSDGRFTTLDLSTGQRKRLGLIVSILDRKPIFIFDELAADQDPEFRKFLYEELLPQLRDQGGTIIAATHDDRYFHVADKVIKLEYGKVDNIRSHPST
jgi:putative ATP-binding cassette transporter